MAQKKRNELAAGLFVILSLGLVLGMVLWLGASKYFQNVHGRAVFYAYADAGRLGISSGGDVYVGDMKIGTVSTITDQVVSPPTTFANKRERASWPKNTQGQFAPRRRTLYHVTITESGYDVFANADAGVSAGLLGGSSMKITFLGTSEAGPANEQSPIHLGGGLPQALDTLAAQFDENNPDSLLSGVKQTVNHLKAASADIAAITKNLRPELDASQALSIAGRLKASMANINDITDDLKGYTKKDLAKILGNISTITDDLKGYTKKDIAEILTNIRKITTSVLATANNLNVSTDKIKQFLTVNYDSLDEIVDNMVLVSANLQAASTEIRRNPWRLFYRPDKNEIKSTNLYDAARAFQEGAAQIDMAVNKLRRTRELDPNDPEAVKEVQAVRVQLLESVKKFRKVEEALWKEVSPEEKKK